MAEMVSLYTSKNKKLPLGRLDQLNIENGQWEPLILTSLAVISVWLSVGKDHITRVKSNMSPATKAFFQSSTKMSWFCEMIWF